MFLLKTLYSIVTLRPMDFTRDIRDKIRHNIIGSVEGSLVTPHGYIICVSEILKIMPLQVNEEGHALFKVKYNALIFKPYKNEVIDVVVDDVRDDGINTNAGFFSVFLSTEDIYKRLKELYGGKSAQDDVSGENDVEFNGEDDDENGDDQLRDGQHRVENDRLKIKVGSKKFEFSKDMVLRVQISSTNVHNNNMNGIGKLVRIVSKRG